MNDSELKKLSRADLLQLLLDERRENERLQLKLKETEEKLSERTIAIDEAGSIAQAVMQLNGVFKVAEAAASQYVENVQRLQTERKPSSGKWKSRQKNAPKISSKKRRHTAAGFTPKRTSTKRCWLKS